MKNLLIILFLFHIFTNVFSQAASDGVNEKDVQEIILNYHKNKIPCFKVFSYSKSYHYSNESEYCIESDTLLCFFNDEYDPYLFIIKNNEFYGYSKDTISRKKYYFSEEFDSLNYRLIYNYRLNDNDTILDFKKIYCYDSLKKLKEIVHFNYTDYRNNYKSVFDYTNNVTKTTYFKFKSSDWIIEKVTLVKNTTDTIQTSKKIEIITNSIFTNITNNQNKPTMELYRTSEIRTIQFNRHNLIKKITTTTLTKNFFYKDKIFDSKNVVVIEVKKIKKKEIDGSTIESL
jgi:hypothetical protein